VSAICEEAELDTTPDQRSRVRGREDLGNTGCDQMVGLAL